MTPSIPIGRSTSLRETARNLIRKNRQSQASVDPDGLGHPDEIVTGNPDDALPSHSTPKEYANIKEVEYRQADEINTLLSNGNVNSVRKRLAEGVDIDVEDRSGNTPLNLLCRRGGLDLIELVLENGASPNIKNDNGSTALATAVFYNRPDVVKILLKYNANLEAEDKVGVTPLELANGYGKSEIAKILSQHQAEIPKSYDSETDRYDESRDSYYYFRHHTNGAITSHLIEDSADEQVPSPKKKSHYRGERSHGTATASGIEIGKKYKISRARELSPHVKNAFKPRGFRLMNNYDLPDEKDRIWKRGRTQWVDLKPELGDKVSDRHGRRFQKIMVPGTIGPGKNPTQKPTVQFAEIPKGITLERSRRPYASSSREAPSNPTYYRTTASTSGSNYRAPRVDDYNKSNEESRPAAPVNQPIYPEPSYDGYNDVLTNPAYRNLRDEAREDIARYNNPRMPADRPEDIVGLTFTETEIRELHHIFQGPPAGDELLRERLRDVVQREFLRIGPGAPRKVLRQPAVVPVKMSTGLPLEESPWQHTAAPAPLHLYTTTYNPTRPRPAVSVNQPSRSAVQAPKVNEDDGIFDFEKDESPPAPPFGHPRAGDAYYVHHDRNGKDTTRWVKPQKAPRADEQALHRKDSQHTSAAPSNSRKTDQAPKVDDVSNEEPRPAPSRRNQGRPKDDSNSNYTAHRPDDDEVATAHLSSPREAWPPSDESDASDVSGRHVISDQSHWEDQRDDASQPSNYGPVYNDSMPSRPAPSISDELKAAEDAYNEAMRVHDKASTHAQPVASANQPMYPTPRASNKKSRPAPSTSQRSQRGDAAQRVKKKNNPPPATKQAPQTAANPNYGPSTFGSAPAESTNRRSQGVEEQPDLMEGYTLYGRGLWREATEAFDAVSRYAKGETDPEIREIVAHVLIKKSFAFNKLNDWSNEIEALNELDGRFGRDTEPAMREIVASTLVFKSIKFRERGLRREEIEALDAVDRRFRGDAEPAMRTIVATALQAKGSAFGELNDWSKAIEAFDEVHRLFGRDTEPAVREFVAGALSGKGLALRNLAKPKEEIAAHNARITRFVEATEPAALRELVAKAAYGDME